MNFTLCFSRLRLNQHKILLFISGYASAIQKVISNKRTAERLKQRHTPLDDNDAASPDASGAILSKLLGLAAYSGRDKFRDNRHDEIHALSKTFSGGNAGGNFRKAEAILWAKEDQASWEAAVMCEENVDWLARQELVVSGFKHMVYTLNASPKFRPFVATMLMSWIDTDGELRFEVEAVPVGVDMGQSFVAQHKKVVDDSINGMYAWVEQPLRDYAATRERPQPVFPLSAEDLDNISPKVLRETVSQFLTESYQAAFGGEEIPWAANAREPNAYYDTERFPVDFASGVAEFTRSQWDDLATRLVGRVGTVGFFRRLTGAAADGAERARLAEMGGRKRKAATQLVTEEGATWRPIKTPKVIGGVDVATVTSKLSPLALQTLMAHVFSVLSNGQISEAYTPPRITFPMQNHTALFMPARIAHATLRGTSIKVVCVPTSPTDHRGLPASTLVLDEETGAVKAILNASNLTALRNAAGSLLSTNLVGPHAPVNVVAFGAGAQIESHLDLHLRAFPSIQTCTIVNRSINERTSKLADLLRTRFPAVQISCIAHDASAPSPDPSLKEAVLAANLIICATSSTAPLFLSSWVSDGTHIVLIGSYKHTMHEVDSALIRRALPSDAHRQSSLLVDSRSACLAEAGELIAAGIEGSQTIEIGELVSFGADGELLLDAARQPLRAETGRTTGPVTIFKSVGVGLQDVAIACAVIQKAEELGLGTYIEWA
ncbi:hypothetical protein B0H12DRAFT_1241859 [Mycena haematopus]|nr:hypothetical protein B0H12DRAFT_1241859 [Mycena haematopus]